ncbi:MAG: carboxypeptidase regulatory-like domain-containing protein, partial [Acidobacteria bacterium]|nr:carboxypeptidase regulatory-like domain-containing protein [Acidobacteriota bacterium]
PVPPGTYEIEAETQGYRRPLGAWRQLVVDNHNEGLQIGLRDMPEIRLHFEDGKGNQVDPKLLTVLARRRNLAGAGPAEPLRLTEGKAFLSAGRWELTLAPSPAFYCEEFAGPGRTSLERGRADGWNEILVLPGETAQVRFTLSLRPASIRGRVTASLDTPAPGAPVYLEAYDLDSRRRLTDLRSARTDLRGHYRFDGLAPGKYRLLSSFEFEAPDSEALDHAGGKLVSVSEGSDLAQDLDLYVR